MLKIVHVVRALVCPLEPDREPRRKLYTVRRYERVLPLV